VQKVYGPKESVFKEEDEKILDKLKGSYRGIEKSTAKQRTLDRMDWWNKLAHEGLSPDGLLRRDLMDSTDSGESIRHTSAFSTAAEYFSKDSNDTDEMDDKIDGGNSLLIAAFEKELGSEAIHKNAPVCEIRQYGKKVMVVFGKEKEKEGDACICTVPANRL